MQEILLNSIIPVFNRRPTTAHVESTVNELINWRFCKKQQMSWTRAGAQSLLHVKTAELNGTLHRYTLHTEAMAA